MGAAQTVGPVVWDYSWFQARYPDLARWVSPEMGQSYFDFASLYLDNTGGSPVRNIGQRQILMGLLTAHIAALNAPLNGQTSSALVGRISSASEGSVSVSVDYPQVAGAEWFNMSKYGAMYWQMTAAYRTMRYIPAPSYSCQPFWRRGYY